MTPISSEALYELYRTRQSDRKFSSTPISKEILGRIVEHSLLAPSATNQQPWHIVVVDDPDTVHRVSRAAIRGLSNMNKFATQASVHLLIVADRGGWLARLGGKVMGVDYRPIDLGILSAHVVLAAQAEGVGSCILGWINDQAIRKELAIPKSKQVVLDILLGYSEQPTRPKKRKPLSETLHHNTW